MTSREKFEQAIKSRFGDLIDYRVCKNSDGEYMAWDMQVAWWAWQAAETDMAVQPANAESKCGDLAAENTGLKNFIINDCHVALIEPETFYEEEVTRYVSADGYEPETPATDAFLAEVRSQGVDAAIEHLNKKFAGTGHISVPVMALEWLAQELRKGSAL
ncbi:hypothetical protein DRC29_21215 [Salmonella enterica]|nr:hypothetical protein [Salmonella enterica]EBJ1501910.1 hypothetical protein [Salmonella enterica]EGX5005975.1 hypothetical protein [Salmonella enterica]